MYKFSKMPSASPVRHSRGWRGAVRAVRIPDKSSKTDGTGSSLPDLDKKTVTLRSLDCIEAKFCK